MAAEPLSKAPEFVFISSEDPRMRHARSLRYHALYEPYGIARGEGWDDVPASAWHLIALSGTCIVAYACVVPSGDSAHIRQVAVDRNHRRRGIATALMRELLLRATEEGFQRAHLNARLDAIALYDRLGFVRVGDVFRTGLTNVPHVRMERELR